MQRPTDADLRDLLTYVHRCAWSIFNRPGHETPLGEFEDAGSEALVYAVTHMHVDHDVPFVAFARTIIFRNMTRQFRRYHQWRFPVAGLSWKPPGEAITPVDTAEVTAATDALLWLRQALKDHAACLSPSEHRTLSDVLAEYSDDDVAARDGVSRSTACRRRRDLCAMLRRHLGVPQTTCAAERRRWMHAPQTRTASHASLAAAD